MHDNPRESRAVGLTETGKIIGYRDPATLIKLINTGQLKAFRARTPAGFGCWRVLMSSIEAFMAKGQSSKVHGRDKQNSQNMVGDPRHFRNELPEINPSYHK